MENTNNSTTRINDDNSEEWVKVGSFGTGIIYANGDRRKLIVEGEEPIFYSAQENQDRLKSNQPTVALRGDIKLDA